MTLRFTGGAGVLVVGHGTADTVGEAETHAVAAAVAALLPDLPVELGFLEVIGPTIAEALARLAARGCRDVVAAPLLLFAAGHAKRDVPEAIAEGARAHGLRVRQADPFGCIGEIAELSRTRRREALAGLVAVPAAETVLVMIGRGSSDPGAVAQLREFAEASLTADPAGRPRRIEFGFVAAAHPRLDEALVAAGDPADAAVRRIVVQPHLLFRGHVEEQVTAAVHRGRDMRPDLEWVQVGRLGADPLVAKAVALRVAAIARPESLSRQGCGETAQ
jgi:sirohydrochlorin cobaltochelatase